MPTQLPTIGRIVHFILPAGPRAGETRAAIVTNTFGGTKCNGTVFLDKANDAPDTKDYFSSAEYDDTDKPVIGTWCWPPRV